jgi:hypothetical protein
MEFHEETYNGFGITVDADGWFNVSKLVAPFIKNNHTARYLKTKKFAALFDGKRDEIMSAQSGHPSETEGKLLKYRDAEVIMREVKGRGKHQGLYLPRDYIDLVLMVLDPNYRATVHEVMAAVNQVHDGQALTLTVTNSSGASVQKEIEFNSAQWQDRMARSIAGSDQIEYWRQREALSDKMW